MEVFDETTAETLQNIAYANSIPPEFLILPFLAACGHFLGKSTVLPWDTWRQPAIIYSTALGFTGTNKSAAMDIVKQAIQEMECTQGISFQNSRINQLESLLKQLTRENRQIMMWDELKTWQTSLGLYKSGSASDYDTTIYLTAYNGYTAKSNPVVKLTGTSHPGEICRRLDEERKTSDNNDGLFSRLLMCMLEPVFSFADDVQTLRNDLPSLARIFYVMEKLHTPSAMYRYQSQALDVGKKYYNDQQTYLQNNHQNDTFFVRQVHRLAMIIQALGNAQELLRDLQETTNCNIDEDLDKKIDDHLKSPEMITNCLISTLSTTKSISLNTYFLNNKRYLAGYTNEEHLKPVSSLNNNLVKMILLWNSRCGPWQ